MHLRYAKKFSSNFFLAAFEGFYGLAKLDGVTISMIEPGPVQTDIHGKVAFSIHSVNKVISSLPIQRDTSSPNKEKKISRACCMVSIYLGSHK